MTSAHPVVLLPGLLCDRGAWIGQMRALGEHAPCRVAAYGMRDTLQAMAQAVLEQAPDEFVVVGHSMGGRVALEICRRAPDRVKALALLDTGYQSRPRDDSGEREAVERMRLVELARREGMRTMGRQWVQRMVHPERLSDAVLIDAILEMIGRSTTDVFEAQQRALLARPDATQLLREIACPTLVLCGREDAWSPPARHEAMARALPHAELVIVERCGHMSTMEQPEAVSAALVGWLSSAVTGSAPG